MLGDEDRSELGRLRRRLLRERAARLEAESIAERFSRGALHDPLTGLANRTLLLDRVNAALTRRREGGGRVGVLFLDLDRFKATNDRFGHGAGDELLREVAVRLIAGCRRSDVVSRLGGDEFVVLCEDIADVAELLELADRVASLLAEPLLLCGRWVTVRSSIGMRLAVQGDTADGVLRDADAAMYAAKRLGSGHRVLFDAQTGQSAADQVGVEEELREGLASGQVQPVYQSVVHLGTGESVGAEGLARWHHPIRGTIEASHFIALAAEAGAAADLDRRIMTAAAEQAAVWGFGSAQPAFMATTLSPDGLDDEHLLGHVADILSVTGLPPGTLGLKITERSLINEGTWTARNLTGLHEMGVLLSIDDFGMASGTFSYLRRYHINALKIDHSLVLGVLTSARERALVAGMVAMAKALDMTTVAKGVESRQQAEVLADIGVDLGHGWHFGPPIPAADTGWLEARPRAL